jgi:D-threonate/D-erythronate kinase
MKHMAIIADDLTGASDSGVQLARKGLATQVIFDLSHFSADGSGVEAIVMDTDSRSVARETAYRRVKEAAAQVKQLGFQHIYKKMDSTLRGNLGIEIDAVMDEIPFDFAVIAPAFPRIGRTTLQGVHHLNGVPVHRTEIANDPKCPVLESDLVKLFSSQSRRKVGLIRLETLRAGAEAFAFAIRKLLEEKTELIVFDAATEDDMKLIAEHLSSSDYRLLWAGSAGLTDYLPEALSLPAGHERSEALPASGHPVLLVAGSISTVTRAQVAVFNQDPTVNGVEFNTVKGVASEDGAKEEMDRCFAELTAVLSSGSDASLYASSSPEDVRLSQEAGATRGITSTDVSNRIASLLGQVASRLIQEAKLQGVILTGGDTAKAVCKQLSVSGIQLIQEVEPGIPLGRLIGANPLLVVTKAGAFGNENSLLHAKHALKGEPTK